MIFLEKLKIGLVKSFSALVKKLSDRCMKVLVVIS